MSIQRLIEQAKIHLLKQQHQQTIDACKEILASNEHCDQAWELLGIVALQAKQFSSALTLFSKASSSAPLCARHRAHLALAQFALGRVDQAIQSIDQAIALAPDQFEFFIHKGNFLQNQRKHTAAIALYNLSLKIKPTALALQNLSNAHFKNHSTQTALCCHWKSLAWAPERADAWSNHGNMALSMQNASRAIDAFEHALLLEPTHQEALRGLAFAQLLSGDYAQGWQTYEHRWQHPEFRANLRSFQQPLWLGHESLMGKVVLLHAEQGLGDTIQFSRFVKGIKALGATILLEVQAPLVPLLRNLPEVDTLLARGQTLPHFDFHCPLMSLPLALKVSLSNLSSWPNLLMPSQPSIARWNKRFESIGGTGVRIGLIWNGGHREHMPSTWEINERRNIAFAQLSQLNHPKLTFFSLQKGEPAQSQLKADLQCHWQTPNFIDLMPEVNDFEDTAAIMMNMDLIIAVDTSCAHLAGALGKETWLLNRFDTCWRWLAQEKQSPWYPSIHIYRQASMGDWSKPLNDMKKDLAERFEL